MDNQLIARYLLHLWGLIYQRWVRPALTTAQQTALDNRLATLKSQVQAGNVPDLAEMLSRFFKLADGMVLQQAPGAVQAWTAAEWSAAIAEKQRIIEIMQGELVKDQEYSAMVAMHQACLTKLENELAEMQVV